MRQSDESGVIVFAIGGRIVRGDVPALCARLRVLLESSPGDEVICDVGELVQVDLAAVETLARLQLVARRHRRRFRVRNAGEELAELLALAGLSEVVPLADALPRQPRGQPEEREQPRRVEEEGDSSDAIPS